MAADKKKINVFRKLTEVQNLLKEIKEEHPYASRKEALGILDSTVESGESTIREYIKAVRGKKGMPKYDKYPQFFSEGKRS